MNWDNIRYIFQIPLNWYKAIHDKIFKAYGTNFIVVKDGYQGGMEIAVDEESFKNAVHEIGGSGTVTAVDGILPNDDGNVMLGAIRNINGHTANENGYVNIGFGVVNSVDGIAPEEGDDGNVKLNAVRSINSNQPDENGNIEIRFVGSVNKVTPTLDGNVEINVGVLTINGEPPDAAGNYDIKVEGVASVNGYEPDEEGRVYIPCVESINDIKPDTEGNINISFVKTINGTEPDSSGNIEIDIGDGYVKSVNGYEPDEAGNVDIPIVESVDGIGPDENGNVSFNLGGNKWVKTDSLGHLTEATTEPFVPDTTKEGYIWNNNGTIEYKNDEFVTLSSEQTITAKKIWDKGGRFNDNVEVYNSILNVTDLTASGTGTSISHGNVILDSNDAFINIGSQTEGQALITVHTGDKALDIYKAEGIELRANANKVFLTNLPTDTNIESRAVATVGYCQSKFAQKSHTHGNISNDGKISTMGVGITTDYIIVATEDGRLYRKSKDDVLPSIGNITTQQITDWGTATSEFATKTELEGYVTDGELDGYVTQDEITDFVTQSEIQDFVTADLLGDYLTINDFGNGFPAASFNGKSGSVGVVSNVSWNGTALVILKTNLNFANGIYTGTSNGGSSTIQTVVFEGI